MEIERKFLLSDLPGDKAFATIEQWQGYLCERPELRIRRILNHGNGETGHYLCIKEGEDLSRMEVELPLEPEQFQQMAQLLNRPLIHKEQCIYALPEGLFLECSRVDEGAFCYAEVEFPTEEAAMSWQPLPWLGRELTWDKGMKMFAYWQDKDAFLARLKQEEYP